MAELRIGAGADLDAFQCGVGQHGLHGGTQPLFDQLMEHGK
jgi:hypothetical protein